ncbi:MAG: hypothetical protein WB588_11695 [Dehalococcoidia bacterium]|jgi:hypothetical protein
MITMQMTIKVIQKPGLRVMLVLTSVCMMITLGGLVSCLGGLTGGAELIISVSRVCCICKLQTNAVPQVGQLE